MILLDCGHGGVDGTKAHRPCINHVFSFSVYSGTLTSWALVDLGETSLPGLAHSYG